MLEIVNHPELTGRRNLPWKYSNTLPLSSEAIEKLVTAWNKEEKEFHFGIFLHASGDMVGYTEADWGWDPHCPGISVTIAPDQQRQGYGSETLGLIVNYLFTETMAHNVSVWVADWNQAGKDFTLKLNFKSCGKERRSGVHDGRFYDHEVFDLLRPEWQSRQGDS